MQAVIGGKFIVPRDINAYRRDVTTGLYGGDVSRKKKGTGQTSKGHFGSHFGPRTRLKACGPSLLEKNSTATPNKHLHLILMNGWLGRTSRTSRAGSPLQSYLKAIGFVSG